MNLTKDANILLVATRYEYAFTGCTQVLFTDTVLTVSISE